MFKSQFKFLDGNNLVESFKLQPDEIPLYFAPFAEPDMAMQIKTLTQGIVWDESILDGPPVMVLTRDDYFSYQPNIGDVRQRVRSPEFQCNITRLLDLAHDNPEKFARIRLIEITPIYRIVRDHKTLIKSNLLKFFFRWSNRSYAFFKILGSFKFIDLLTAKNQVELNENESFYSYLSRCFNLNRRNSVQENLTNFFKLLLDHQLTSIMCGQYKYVLYTADDVISHLQNSSDIIKKPSLVNGSTLESVTEDEQHAHFLKEQAKLTDILQELVANPREDKILSAGDWLQKLWQRLYNKIQVNNHTQIRELENAPKPNSLIYLCSHRSHIDYLMISYVFGKFLGYKLPLIAAGNNLNFFPVGKMFRNTGAFFIRRKFNNALYINAFRSYLSFLLSKNYSLEFFIEGGRSRTGSLLNAKSGLVNIVVDSYVDNPGLDNYFVPTFICYDQVIETQTYINEMKGISKKKENLFLVLANLRKLKRMGNAYVNFAKAIRLQDLFEQYYPSFKEDFTKGQVNAHLVEEIKQVLLSQSTIAINTAVTLGNQSVLATFTHQLKLRSTAGTFSADEFDQYRTAITALFEIFPYSEQAVLGFDKSPKLLDQLLIDNAKHLKLKGDKVEIDDQLLELLNYSRNNVAHVYLAPGLAGLIILNNTNLYDFSDATLAALIKYYNIYYSVAEFKVLVQAIIDYFIASDTKPSILLVLANQVLDALIHHISISQVFKHAFTKDEKPLRSKAFSMYSDNIKVLSKDFKINACEFFYKTHFDAIYTGVDSSISFYGLDTSEKLVGISSQIKLLSNLIKKLNGLGIYDNFNPFIPI